jgi:hypothetical protein
MATKNCQDLRLYARFELGSEAKLVTPGSKSDVVSRLVDIGLGGVNLETAAPLKANSSVKLHIELEGVSLQIAGRVLYCTKGRSGAYNSGLKFAPDSHQDRVSIAEFVHSVFQREWNDLGA